MSERFAELTAKLNDEIKLLGNLVEPEEETSAVTM